LRPQLAEWRKRESQQARDARRCRRKEEGWDNNSTSSSTSSGTVDGDKLEPVAKRRRRSVGWASVLDQQLA
jgi:hypothetical protein